MAYITRGRNRKLPAFPGTVSQRNDIDLQRNCFFVFSKPKIFCHQGKAEDKVKAKQTQVKVCQKKCQVDNDKCTKNHAASQPSEEISEEALRKMFEEYQALQSAGKITTGVEENSYEEMKKAKQECQESIDTINKFNGEQATLR